MAHNGRRAPLQALHAVHDAVTDNLDILSCYFKDKLRKGMCT